MNLITCVTVSSVLMMSMVHTVHSLSEETLASQYIVHRLLPSHPVLAIKLLKVLAQQRNLKQFPFGMDTGRHGVVGDSGINDSDNDNDNDNDAVVADDDDDEFIDAAILADSDSRGNEMGRASGFESNNNSNINSHHSSNSNNRRSLLRAIRPQRKRGLGHCIHNCINGRGNMNFIQCKSMCH